ncbi:MAG TPA: nuclear transport factor 2 family protein [Terriglobia bacterium]|nr:nuclear transport factor 2 family protein [Terriglobia bacterium]
MSSWSEDTAPSTANAHVGLVAHAYAALNANNVEILAGLLHPDVSWFTPGRSPAAGEALGRDAVIARFRTYAAETRGTFRMNLRKLLHSRDGRVVAIHHDTGERNGNRLNVGCCTVFDFEDGLILEAREHFFDLYGWDEFWSRHI